MDPHDVYQMKTTTGTRNPKVLQNSLSKSFLATKGSDVYNSGSHSQLNKKRNYEVKTGCKTPSTSNFASRTALNATRSSQATPQKEGSMTMNGRMMQERMPSSASLHGGATKKSNSSAIYQAQLHSYVQQTIIDKKSHKKITQ